MLIDAVRVHRNTYLQRVRWERAILWSWPLCGRRFTAVRAKDLKTSGRQLTGQY